MAKSNPGKELFQRISSLEDEIKEGLKRGRVHIVGEIMGESVEVEAVTFESEEHRLLLPLPDEGRVLFMYPVRTSNPRRIYLELWAFLRGKAAGPLEVGSTVRGVLRKALEKRGYGVVWMNIRERGTSKTIEVLASKEGSRYRLVFEERKPNEFLLVEKENV